MFLHLFRGVNFFLFVVFSHFLGLHFKFFSPLLSLILHTFWVTSQFDPKIGPYIDAKCFQEGHLRNGDHLLQVGDVRLWGMGAQQVGVFGEDSCQKENSSFYTFMII